MSSRRFIAYYRVSTARQGASGLGLEAQTHAVRSYLAGISGELLSEFTEIESGRCSQRPELAKALMAARVHRATLVLAKLDRLARNVAFISNLLEAGVEVCAADMPAANTLTLHLMASVAEAEAKMISERTKLALAEAKKRGVKLGGFRGYIGTAADRAHATAAKVAVANERAIALASTIRQIQSEGADTYRAIAERLNALSIPTTGSFDRRGQQTGHRGAWSAMQAQRVIARIEKLENRN